MRLRHIGVSLTVLLLAGCGAARGTIGYVATHTACTTATFYRPRWSPDGTRIAYLFSDAAVSSGGSTDIRVMAADGSEVREVLSDPNNYMWSLAWWPSGDRLAFDYQSTALRSIPAEGGEATMLVEGNEAFVANPDWSRDGKRLIFASNRAGNWDIFFTDAPAPEINMQRWFGVGVERYADGLGDEQAPAISPDNSTVAFVSSREGGFDLYTRPASGGPARRLTASSEDEYHPSWSVDGKRIVYSVGYGTSARVVVIDAEGGNRTAIGEGYTPDWSPDGERIVFVSEMSGLPEIYTMRPDGSDVKKIAANPTREICPH